MSGTINEKLSKPIPKRIGEVTPMEWFRCQFDGRAGIAMLTIPKRMVQNTDTVLFVDKDGGLSPLNVDAFNAYGGKILDYLTTEESVTIFGGRDPNWEEPEPKLPVPLAPPADPLDLNQVAIGVPFYFTWTTEGTDCVGLKMRSKNRHDGDWIMLRLYRDKVGRGMISSAGHTSRHRRFECYAPHELDRFRGHYDRNAGVWEEEVWPKF